MKLGQFVFVQQFVGNRWRQNQPLQRLCRVFCNEQQSDIRLGVRNMSTENKNVKEWTEQEWKTRLNPEQYRVLRLKGTELAGSGSYNKHYKEGTYLCAGCKMPVYTSETKFDSGCGWPAFYDAVPNAIKVSQFIYRRYKYCFRNASSQFQIPMDVVLRLFALIATGSISIP